MTGDKRRMHLSRGFSLIEILITVTLFSIAAVILSQTYVSFNRLHRKVSNAATLSQDMRFATEFLVRQARNTPINYGAYADQATVASSSEIHLMTQSASTIDIAVRTAECNDLPTVHCLALSKDGGAHWSPITGKHENVDFFGAYVRPTQSPFVQIAGSYPNNTQPMLTFSLKLEYMADNPRDDATLQSQTTVSSRVYAR